MLNILLYLIDYIFIFITYFKYLFLKFNRPKDVIFSIKTINNDDKDITKIYWILKNKNYTSFFKKDRLEFFPHYNLDTMLNFTPEHKIFASFLHSNKSNIENVTAFIQELAGPMQNFYSDTEYIINTKDIFGLCDKVLSIITINNKFVFDLSKNNLLNLK